MAFLIYPQFTFLKIYKTVNKISREISMLFTSNGSKQPTNGLKQSLLFSLTTAFCHLVVKDVAHDLLMHTKLGSPEGPVLIILKNAQISTKQQNWGEDYSITHLAAVFSYLNRTVLHFLTTGTRTLETAPSGDWGVITEGKKSKQNCPVKQG